MIVSTRFRLAAVAASTLLFGFPGCGFTPVASSPASTGQPPEIALETSEVASVDDSTSAKDNAAEKAPAVSMVESQQTYRNPFRPPTVKARTLTPQQAESADIRLLGIAKRDSQHIALLESAGKLHKAIVGDFVDQWEVLSVDDSETTLRRGLEQMSLRIR